MDALQGTFVSMGVYSDGSYNTPPGIIFSYPVICKNGDWSIVQGMWNISIKLATFFMQLA